jgi:hypothetical protein
MEIHEDQGTFKTIALKNDQRLDGITPLPLPLRPFAASEQALARTVPAAAQAAAGVGPIPPKAVSRLSAARAGNATRSTSS